MEEMGTTGQTIGPEKQQPPIMESLAIMGKRLFAIDKEVEALESQLSCVLTPPPSMESSSEQKKLNVQEISDAMSGIGGVTEHIVEIGQRLARLRQRLDIV